MTQPNQPFGEQSKSQVWHSLACPPLRIYTSPALSPHQPIPSLLAVRESSRLSCGPTWEGFGDCRHGEVHPWRWVCGYSRPPKRTLLACLIAYDVINASSSLQAMSTTCCKPLMPRSLEEAKPSSVPRSLARARAWTRSQRCGRRPSRRMSASLPSTHPWRRCPASRRATSWPGFSLEARRRRLLSPPVHQHHLAAQQVQWQGSSFSTNLIQLQQVQMATSLMAMSLPTATPPPPSVTMLTSSVGQTSR